MSFKITIFLDDLNLTGGVDYDEKNTLSKAKTAAMKVIHDGAVFDTITGAFHIPPHRVIEIKIEEIT